MPFIGTGHIWLILILLIVVLIIWGPGKLPDVGAGLGRAIREFRKASQETKEEFQRSVSVDKPVSSNAPEAATHPGGPAAPAEPAPVAGGTVTGETPRDPDQPAG